MAASSKTLHIDIETYSSVDLREAGVYAYAASEDFEILLIAYAYGDGEVRQVDLGMHESAPSSLIADICDPTITKVAHSAVFERVCLSRWLRDLGILKTDYLSPVGWDCTMVRAAELGLPMSLEKCGEALHLSEETTKLKTGKVLIQYFCKPCKPTRANNYATRVRPQHDQAKWNLFKEYNIRDVVAEREIHKIELSYGDRDPHEKRMYAIDQLINDDGVGVDMDFCERVIAYSEGKTDGLIEEARRLTGCDNPNSLEQTKAWLRKRGVVASSLDKDALEDLLKHEDQDVREYAEIRKELGKTSVAKYDAISRSAIWDEKSQTYRVHGMLMFYGAMRTGRWAGRIVQLQNLPRNTESERALEAARALARAGEFGAIEMLFERPMDIMSQLIRTAFIPSPGSVYVVADYNAIEARVIAWYAGEEWKLGVFERGGKIYEETASRMFGIPISAISHDSPERAKGKVAELAGGYGGGREAYKRMGADRYGWTDSEIDKLVNDWREANPRIVEYWRVVESAAKRAIKSPGTTEEVGHGASFKMERDTLFLTLPSGRRIAYKGATLVKGRYGDEINYLGEITGTNKYGMVKTYGGKLVENLVQATARDCLAYAMDELRTKGWRIVFHVHDEVVIEVPEGYLKHDIEGAIKEMMALKKVAWKEGLPLRAESYVCPHYIKR